MTIYIDIIFLENLFMNFIIIYACEIILKIPIKILRTILSSILGSIYAIISYTSSLKIYSSIFLKIMLSIAMVYIAFNPKNFKALIKYLAVFYLTSFTFGGVAFAFLYFVNPEKILIKSGVLIGTYPIKIIITGGLFGFVLITAVFKSIKGRLNKNNMFCKIKVLFDNKELITKAIIDTGNFLKDPITKTPVIVIEKKELTNIIPEYILNNLDKIIKGNDLDLGEYKSRIRIIPYASLGKENGMLIGIKVDSVTVCQEENAIILSDIIIGIYNGVLSKTGKYHGLIGIDAIGG